MSDYEQQMAIQTLRDVAQGLENLGAAARADLANQALTRAWSVAPAEDRAHFSRTVLGELAKQLVGGSCWNLVSPLLGSLLQPELRALAATPEVQQQLTDAVLQVAVKRFGEVDGYSAEGRRMLELARAEIAKALPAAAAELAPTLVAELARKTAAVAMEEVTNHVARAARQAVQEAFAAKPTPAAG